MSVVEQTSARAGSRFGKLSTNMFFIRNTAQPKRVRHIEGLNGALICNVNDDPSAIRSQPTSALNFSKTNMSVLETPRRVERLVPPMGFWNTHGIIHDTERWKKELAALATASGLGVDSDEYKHSSRPSQATADQQHASRSGAHYSKQTGRFNESSDKSRGRTSSRRGTAAADVLFTVPENEREMWMLQVLCQLLNTSNLEDIQSWLVSASQTEKDHARTMINSALRGLQESEHSSVQSQEAVDLNALSNFVEKQKHEERSASQKYINNSLYRHITGLQSIDEEQQTDISFNGSLDGTTVNSDVTQQNFTAYKQTHSKQQGSQTSFDRAKTTANHQTNHDTEQIDTIRLEDDRQRPQSATFIKQKKVSTVPDVRSAQPISSHKQKHTVESMQFIDNENETNVNGTNENTNEQQQKELTISSISTTKPPSTDDNDGNMKSRKIRQLQRKLSEQEEETKKKFDELQSKQSRLENALKLLMKQTATYKKRQKPSAGEVEDLDAPVVNVIIQSPRDAQSQNQTTRQHHSSKTARSKTTPNDKKTPKISDYTVDDVKVQISLSRLDNHSNRTYAGVWKPDASTLQRLQAN